MTTAVHNVAYAIMKSIEKFNGVGEDGVRSLVDYAVVAEHAISALRTPTDEMMEVISALPQYHNSLDQWCAMIDVALGRIVLAEPKDEEEVCD